VAEVTVDTDQNTVVIHDGVTQGGHYAVSSEQLNANLSIIQGVTDSQNTAIQAVDNYAHGAYDLANTKFASAGGTISGAVQIDGDLTVNGNTFYANVTSLIVEDNIIVVNSNVTGTPSLNAGLEVNRGNQPNTSVLWNESQKHWTITNDGTTFDSIIVSQQLTDNVAFIQGINAQQNTNLSTANTFLQANDYATWLNSQLYTNTANSSMKSYVDNANTSLKLYSEANTGAALAAAKTYTDTANTNLKAYVDNLVTLDFNTIQAINDSQNTAIQAVDNYAHGAYDLANTKFASAGGTISGDVAVTGNLTVTGTTFYANTTNLNVEDNVITVNSNITGTPTLNAGLEVNRGNQPNTSVLWNEANKKWTITNDGGNWYPLLTELGGHVQTTLLANSFISASNNDVGQVTIGNDGIEIGLQNRIIPGTPHIDFHSSGQNLDYDVRLIASDGLGAGVGSGTLNVIAQDTYFSDRVTTNGTLTVEGTTTFNDTTNSISNTSGAVVIAGGLGVGANISFGQSGGFLKSSPNEVMFGTNEPVDIGIQAGGNKFVFHQDATFQIPQGADITDYTGNTVLNLQAVTTKGPITDKAITLTNTTNSTSTGTGALIVDGGVGIQGNLYSQAIYSDNYFTTDKVSLIQPVNQFAQDAYNQANTNASDITKVRSFAQSGYDTANTAVAKGVYLQGVDDTQNTNITAVNNYAAGAYAQANTNADNISIIQGVDLTQNTNITATNNKMESAYAQANTNATNISIINGVDLSQNTYITAVEGYAQSGYAQANATNNIAQGAYDKANGAVQFTSFLSSPNQFVTTNAAGYITTTSAITTSNVTSNALALGSPNAISTRIAEVIANVAGGSPVVVDSFRITDYRMAKYSYVVTASVGYQFHELLVIHDDTVPTLQILVETVPTGKIANYSVSLSGGVVTLYANCQSQATFVCSKEYFYNSGSNYLPTDLQLGTASTVDLVTGIPGSPVIDLPVTPV
jgi:hypothetical protein